jgi:hypothetical protein
MSKINLIPEVRQEKLRLQRLNSVTTTAAVVVAVVFVAVIIILSLYAGVLAAQKSSINHDINSVQESLNTMKDLEKTVTNLEGGLADIKEIVNGNKDWSSFLTVLEKSTPGDIQFTNLAINSGVANASLVGKDIKAIDRFINSFSNVKNDKGDNYFSDVKVTGYSRKDNGQYTFQTTFNLNGSAIW